MQDALVLSYDVRNLTGRLIDVLRHLLAVVRADSLSFGLLI